MGSFRPPETWTNVPIARIEDLRDAVYGAGLEATQMSTALLSGNLTFARRNDVLYSSGLINGQVALQGPLSAERLTVGVGLRMGAGTRHWLEETPSGAVGVFHGDEHDAFYTPGSLYATATLSLDRLEALAAQEELANPAVSIARAVTNTFAGIRPIDLPGFIVAQIAGALGALALATWLLRPEGRALATDPEARL